MDTTYISDCTWIYVGKIFFDHDSERGRMARELSILGKRAADLLLKVVGVVWAGSHKDINAFYH